MFRTAFQATLMAISISAATLANAQQASDPEHLMASNAPANPEIQFNSFLELGRDLQQLREARRIPVSKFMEMAKDPNTIILDTRSREAYENVHIADAIHLNFSDFTDEKLSQVIPSKTTRILIYCNNNFIDDTPSQAVESQELDRLPSPTPRLTDKRPALALNIPTFINLHGYGYENVYELADRLSTSDQRITLVGKSIPRRSDTTSGTNGEIPSNN